MCAQPKRKSPSSDALNQVSRLAHAPFISTAFEMDGQRSKGLRPNSLSSLNRNPGPAIYRVVGVDSIFGPAHQNAVNFTEVDPKGLRWEGEGIVQRSPINGV